ncbi:MAG: hypothetical protein WBC92_17935, partial [Terracidiphilus sp.]
MKNVVFLFAILYGGAASLSAAAPSPLATLSAVAALTNAQASQHPPVSFEATVNYYFQPGSDLVVQDRDTAVFVRLAKDFTLVPGDRVLVRGTAEPSFLPYIAGATATFLRHGTLP